MSKYSVIPLQKASSSAITAQLSEHFNVPLNKDCQRNEIRLPKAIASPGTIVSYTPARGIDALVLDVCFQQNTELLLQGDFPAPLTFHTMVKGELEVITSRKNFKIAPLQSTIHAGFTNDSGSYRFASGKRIKCMIIYVHKSAFFGEIDCDVLDVPDDLMTVIETMSRRDESFLYQDIFHLPAVNTVNDILLQESIGLINSSLATAKIYENLFLQLQEYKTSVTETRSRQKIKREEKLEIIQNAESILITHLQSPPTIPELARMVGINQQDLKQGFRQVYGETINQYLTERRLEQAGILIRGGKLSIAEVADAVGYNSPSYFTRRFKEKYGVGPKQFTRLADTSF